MFVFPNLIVKGRNLFGSYWSVTLRSLGVSVENVLGVKFNKMWLMMTGGFPGNTNVGCEVHQAKLMISQNVLV